MGVELEPNAIVLGRFRLDRLLGEGGMGLVWAATNTVTLKPTALKFLKPSQAADPRVRQRFLREARAACAVRHPNVVEIHDVLELDDGSPVMVMDLLEGETLGHRVDRERILSLGELAPILLQVVSAVGTAHAHGVVHRDLKPDNIFLVRNEDGSQTIRVLDFGIAKMTATDGSSSETGALTGTGAMLGTPYYMSPEQIFGEKDIDHGTDIWALGVIIYECLSGARPTQADNIGQILKIVTTDAIRPLDAVAPSVPADISELVGRMLSRDRTRRPASLREVRAVLERYGDIRVSTFGDPVAPPPRDPSLDTTDSGRSRVVTGDAAVNPLAQTREDPSLAPPARTSGNAVSPAASTMPLNTNAPLVVSVAERKRPRALFALGLVGTVAAVGFLGWRVTHQRPAPAAAISTAAAPSVSASSPPSAAPPPPSAVTSTEAASAVPTVAPSATAKLRGKGAPNAAAMPSVAIPKAATADPTKPPPTAAAPGGVVDRPPF